MTLYEEIKGHLEKRPLARERSMKNRFLAVLLLKKYESEMQTGVTDGIIERLIVDASSYDRVWRQVLQHEKHLRGTDYDEKYILEQEKILELGYQPGVQKDIKRVADIAKPYKD